jgi:predicted  nucleic acid-binding Zn-ribbon protein
MDNQILTLEGLQLQSLNKEAILSQSLLIRDNINDGYLDALEVLISAKKMQELGKQLEEVSRPIAEDKTRLQKGEVYKTQSVEVVEKTIGSKTDYSNCNDEVWEKLQQDLSDLKEAIKQRENFLSAITTQTTIVTNDGEIVTLNPPIKSGRIGLSLTIK